jgi:2,3-dihydroxybiphenyl 1,2-dioxygenase
MASVSELAYLGLRGQDLRAWRTFATEVLGMQAAPESDDETLYLRLDQRAYRLAVEKGEPGLGYLGLQVAGPEELAGLVAVLEAAGVSTKEDAALAKARRVRRLVSCQDPAGNDVELVVGPLTANSPFASPRGIAFKTEGQGLGHAFMLFPDATEAWHFYVDLLGFRLSDTISFGLGEGTFLHCNSRHHSLAFAQAPGVNRLAHIMVEVDSLDAVGRGWDLVEERNVPISATLGMHTNDEMVSFYVKTPSGFDIEYGTNGRYVDDATWTVGHYEATSYWGHKRSGVPG